MWRNNELASSSPRCFEADISSDTNSCLTQCSALEYHINSSSNDLVIENETCLTKNTNISLEKALEAIKDISLEDGDESEKNFTKRSLKESINKSEFYSSSAMSLDASSLWNSMKDKSKFKKCLTEYSKSNEQEITETLSQSKSKNSQFKWREKKAFLEDSCSETDTEQKIKSSCSFNRIPFDEAAKQSRKTYVLFADSDSDLDSSLESDESNNIKVIEKVYAQPTRATDGSLHDENEFSVISPLNLSCFYNSVNTKRVTLDTFIDNSHSQTLDTRYSQNNNELTSRTLLSTTNMDLEESKSETELNRRIDKKPSCCFVDIEECDSNESENLDPTDQENSFKETSQTNLTNVSNSMVALSSNNIQILIETQTPLYEEGRTNDSINEIHYHLEEVITVNDTNKNIDTRIQDTENETIATTQQCDLSEKPSCDLLKLRNEVKKPLLNKMEPKNQAEKENLSSTQFNDFESRKDYENNNDINQLPTKHNDESLHFSKRLDIFRNNAIVNENYENTSHQNKANKSNLYRSEEKKKIYSRMSKLCGKFSLPATLKNEKLSLKTPPVKNIQNQSLNFQGNDKVQLRNFFFKVTLSSDEESEVNEETKFEEEVEVSNVKCGSSKPKFKTKILGGKRSLSLIKFKPYQRRRLKQIRLSNAVTSGLRRSERLRKKREAGKEMTYKECGSLCNSITYSAYARRNTNMRSRKLKRKVAPRKRFDSPETKPYSAKSLCFSPAIKASILSKIQKKFKTDASVMCDNIIEYLSTKVDPNSSEDEKNAAFTALLQTLHRLGICKTVLEFYSFIMIYTPFYLHNKILPLNGFFSCTGTHSDNRISDSITKLYKNN